VGGGREGPNGASSTAVSPVAGAMRAACSSVWYGTRRQRREMYPWALARWVFATPAKWQVTLLCFPTEFSICAPWEMHSMGFAGITYCSPWAASSGCLTGCRASSCPASPTAGLLLDGQRHGFGRMEFQKGDSYEGTWERGMRSGAGRLRSAASGDVFVGHFRQDKRHGPGTLYMVGKGFGLGLHA
jgi:hypothetical protein